MNKKVPITEIGKVRPVITVERQEFKNKNTIKTVNKAPSIKVRFTLSTATRIVLEPSVTFSSFQPLGIRLCISSRALFKPSTT